MSNKSKFSSLTQIACRGFIVRSTHQRIQFLELSVRKLKVLFENLGLSSTKTALESELEQKISQVRDDFITPGKILFAFNEAKILSDKLVSTTDELHKSSSSFNYKIMDKS